MKGLITGFLPEKIQIPFEFFGMEVSEMKNPTKSAFILIDMEQGFIDPASAHCIKGAAATVPTCEKAIQMSRQKGIPIFFVKRIYRENGGGSVWNLAGTAGDGADAGDLYDAGRCGFRWNRDASIRQSRCSGTG